MKQIIFTVLFLSLIVTECSAQWKNDYFPNPLAFGTIDTIFFASQQGSSGHTYRSYPSAPYKQIESDTGLPNGNVTSFGSVDTTFFAGTTNRGVFRSTDQGHTWILCRVSVGNMAFDTIGGIIFAGGIGPLGYGGGIYRSTNSGIAWSEADTGLIDKRTYALAVSGTTLFAGTSSGVFRSTDLGQSWQATSMTKPVNSLAVLGTNIFTATYGKNFGADAGVYCSSDNGIHWKQDTVGLFNRIVSTLVTNGRYLFAGTGAEAGDGSYVYGSGVFMSTDSGQHWDTINYGLPQGSYHGVNDFLSVNALGVFDTLLFVGVWNGAGVLNETYVRSIPEILRQKGDTEKGAVSEPVIASDSIAVYPNPASGVVTIRSAGTRILGVRVLNIMGTEVLTIPRGYNSELHLDVSQLPSGTYFLEVETMDGMILRKITRE